MRLLYLIDFLANRADTLFKTNLLAKYMSRDWPVTPFTPWHAQQILDFVFDKGFSCNIHINCTYGRSRSIAVAQFLSLFLFPKHDLILGRDEARMNTRVFYQLTKLHFCI